jgi:peptidyl-Asp metalloendopeptidase
MTFRLCAFALVGAFCSAPALGQDLTLLREITSVARALPAANVVREQQLELAPSALAALHQAARVTLNLFPDVTIRAVRQQVEPTADGFTWVGTVEGYPEGAAILAVVRDELVGHIYTPFGFLRIQRDANAAYVVQQVAGDAVHEGNDVLPAEPGLTTAGIETWKTMADSGNTIDVMVVYTGAAAAGWGNDSRARAAIELVVAETNQAIRNSGVNSGVRLVHVAQVGYTESGDSAIDLGRLQAQTDGFLDDVHSTRDRYAADVVMLIAERSERTVSGRAYLNGPRSGAATGFGFVRRDAMDNGRTFAHELGHVLGAHHDWYVTSEAGAFSYSKGYVSLAGRFLDLMAYYDVCTDTKTFCAQLLQYSNPRLSQNGRRTGVTAGTSLSCTARSSSTLECDADAAGTLTNMLGVVAGFRDSRTALAARQILPDGAIRSENGRYRLTYQNDGNLVLYDDQARVPLWSSNTGATRPGQTIMQADGNLVVYDAQGIYRWSSGTAVNPNAYFTVQNDGNLVVFRSDGQPIWGAR